MFYVAEAILLGEGLTFSKHSAVIAAFGEHFVKPGRIPPEFHRYLIEGEDNRHLGDYGYLGTGLSRDAERTDRSRQRVFETRSTADHASH